jgi:hypothetical protein
MQLTYIDLYFEAALDWWININYLGLLSSNIQKV